LRLLRAETKNPGQPLPPGYIILNKTCLVDLVPPLEQTLASIKYIARYYLHRRARVPPRNKNATKRFQHEAKRDANSTLLTLDLAHLKIEPHRLSIIRSLHPRGHRRAIQLINYPLRKIMRRVLKDRLRTR